ncbi:deoxynucleotide monophosphate kinase family protein [Nocardioides ochotonae]|uniref:deoxynucleotide monophosphate kinase family protein n=1 Tax=Nocardioides ochotonae TaxID=2685869 RepID=UPI00140E4210|nr:hypothetical protein [Nocardioides ochotonae]
MSLVGIVGKKRAGKDTLAGYLIPHGYTRFAFADPLKVALLATNPLYKGGQRLGDLIDSTGWETAKALPEVRRLLQEFGGAVRALDRDFWVRATLPHAVANGRAVVTDVRYRNEADGIRAAGGYLVRVVRPDCPTTLRTGDGQTVPLDTHDSETELDGYPVDLEVVNHTLEDLEAAAATILARAA